jgi:hypothetical protein
MTNADQGPPGMLTLGALGYIKHQVTALGIDAMYASMLVDGRIFENQCANLF